MQADNQGRAVKVEGLSRTFQKGGKSIEVLKEVSIELAPGDQVSIVGPSGCGKSTFLQILGTLDRPTTGKVWMDGRDVFELPQREIDRLRNSFIGFVFQFHHLLPDQSALGNVALPMIIQGQPVADAQRVARARLDRVGLSHRLNHVPGELSGGEQQRVAIARALVMNPGLLLADEPTGNLDPNTAKGVFELLLELHAESGSTLVVVTHSHELAARFPRRLQVADGLLVEV
ncbi:MAG: lipoprotein-releasing system ATP-binding protein [Cognaticolwellia sp.]